MDNTSEKISIDCCEDWRAPGWRAPGWRAPGWRAPGWRAPGWRAPGNVFLQFWPQQATRLFDRLVYSAKYFYIYSFLALMACTNQPKPQAIVDKAIATHGGEKYREAVVEFDFRERHYKAVVDGGKFRYERSWTDSVGEVLDVFTNDVFSRKINNQPFEVSDEYAKRYSNSINSVIYFALLPYYLNDPAVVKEYLEEAVVEGQPYHKIKVTFREEGGGKDHEDVFVYWFHKDTSRMDYLAYQYETDGGGSRFRKAYHQREVGGILFADYINYEGPYPAATITNFDEMYEQGKLKELSQIELENIEVKDLGQGI